MNKKILVYCLYVAFVFIPFRSKAQVYSPTERQFILSSIWKDVSEHFYNPQKLKTINWDSLYMHYSDEVYQLKDDVSFCFLAKKFMALLEDEHTEFDASYYYRTEVEIDCLPLEIKQIHTKFYVLGILKKWVEDIPLGSEVLKINNMPPLKYLEQNQIPYTSGNTLHSRLNIARKNMTYGKSNDSIKIEIKKTNNQVKELVLKYEGKKELNSMDDMTFTAFSVFNRTNVNTLSDKLEQNHILYLRYDGFDRRDGIVDELRQKINNDISYIILDLRNNRGGDESVADSLLMCLVDIDTLFTYRSITRTSNAFYAAMGYGYPQYNDYYEGLALDTLPEETYIKGDLPLFNQPLFVLISEETCSAAEDFLIALKLHFPQRAILVGVPTAGSTGAPFVRNLEKKRMYYRICTRFPLLPEGMFENGIQPDYYYEKNLDEYLTGEDKIFQYVDKIKKNKEK